MALSKRARDAIGVLEQEAQGNSAAASALASLDRALAGHAPDGDRDTPGRRQSKEITEEGKNNLASKTSGSSPKAPPFGGDSSSKSATDSNSPKSKVPAFLERRRRGTARKG